MERWTVALLDDQIGLGAGKAAIPWVRSLEAEMVAFDVLRAHATIAVLLSHQPSGLIWIANSVRACWRFRNQVASDACLFGERKTRPIPGFDFGNSPVEALQNRDRWIGRPVVLTTSNGTPLLMAGPRGHTWVGGLINVWAVIRRVRAWMRAKRCVMLVVASGRLDDDPWDNEDLLTVAYVLWHVRRRWVARIWPGLHRRWSSHPPTAQDWATALRHTLHGQKLVRMGFEDDINWIAASVGQFRDVPQVLKGKSPVAGVAAVGLALPPKASSRASHIGVLR